MLFEAASWVYKTFLGAHNNLYRDPKNWQRLVDAVEEAYPDDPNRRLSANAPSRYQHMRARKRFLNGDVCGDRYIDLLDKFPALDALVHGLVYDGAADSELVDRILNRGKHPVVPTSKTSAGNHAAANLGAYNFKTTTGAISYHTVIAIAGSAVVVFPDVNGDACYVPLDCKQRKRVARKDGYTIYGLFEMPDNALVPTPLIGAQAIIPFNSTHTEINAKPHKRRTRASRSIAPSDPRYARIRGLRPDVESTNSHIKDLLPFKPARLRTSQHDHSRLNILTYCIL